jgi:hypothetical protein
MGNNGKLWLNGSGCPDPVAYEAMKNIRKEEKILNQPIDDAAHKVVTIIKSILDLSGFELVGRIQIRHKKSGNIYK